jgi:hypothetical protein
VKNQKKNKSFLFEKVRHRKVEEKIKKKNSASRTLNYDIKKLNIERFRQEQVEKLKLNDEMNLSCFIR